MAKPVSRIAYESMLAIVVLLLSSILIMALAGCLTNKPEDAPLAHLKVATSPFLGFAPFYIAQDEGYYEEQGLEVEFVKFSSATQAIPLVAQGRLDVVSGGISASLINAATQDINVKIVAGGFYLPPGGGSTNFMVRRDLYVSGEVDTVDELKGRKIVMNCLGCVCDFMASKLLASAGLSLADVQVAKMDISQMVSAFESKAIDVALMGPPEDERAKALGYAVLLISGCDVIPGFQKTFMMFGPNLLEKNPELGDKFMAAYIKGVRQYNQGPTAKNVEIVNTYTGIDKEVLMQSVWEPIYPDARIRIDDILSFQDWAYDNGLLDKKVTMEQLIDTRFIDYANKVLGPAR